MIMLATLAERYGVRMHYHSLTTESLVQRARNYCAEEFLKSNATHLMFIDADIEFDPMDVFALMLLSNKTMGYDVACGPYPLKNIAWEKVKIAVDKGLGDSDPNSLAEYSTDYVFNVDASVKSFNLNEPFLVSEAGTGFMCIPRYVLEEFRKSYPEQDYTPDHVRSVGFDGSKKITCFFDCEIDPISNRYLSEDYWFCNKISKIGLKIGMCPWIKLNHVGMYKFDGNLEAIARAGLTHGKSI